MEYPGAKFTQPIRRAMLVSFIALFFILSPMIIMYTIGYRFSWRHGVLRETGSLSIDIEPSDVRVYLDNVRLKYKMPVRLNNVAPKKYSLRLSAFGYLDWKKNIEIKNKQTVYIKELKLIKKERPEFLFPGVISGLSLSPNRSKLAYILRRGSDAEVWITGLEKNDVPRLLQKFSVQDELGISWGDNNFFAIANKQAPYTILTIIDAGDQNTVSDIAAREKGSITKWQWAKSNSAEIFYSTEAQLKSFLLHEERARIVSAKKPLDWLQSYEGWWTIDINSSSDKYILTRDAFGFSEEFWRFDRLPEESPGGARAGWQILGSQNNNVLLKENHTQKMIMVTPEKQFEINSHNWRLSAFNNWWLFWTPWELWSFSAGEEPYILNRSGEQLQEVIPLDKYNTLALVWANKTTALYPYYLVSHELIDSKIVSAAADNKNRILFFSATIGGKEGVWRLNY